MNKVKNKNWMRIISFILVVALLVTSTPIQNLSAAEKEVYLKRLEEMVASAVGEEREILQDVLVDAKSKKGAGDWWQACFSPNGDKLPPNYFHNNVQKRIRGVNDGFNSQELYYF